MDCHTVTPSVSACAFAIMRFTYNVPMALLDTLSSASSVLGQAQDKDREAQVHCQTGDFVSRRSSL